jgi:hypothetical protein
MRHKARVEMIFSDGSTESETVEAQRGSPARFPSEADLVEKFLKLTRTVMPAGQAGRIVETVLGLEDLADARALAGLLRVAA